MENYTEDIFEFKPYDVKLTKRLLAYILPYRYWLLLCLLILFLVTGLELAGPYIVKQTIDNFIMTKDVSGVKKMGLFYLLVLTGIAICQYALHYLLQKTGQKIMYDLRTHLFSHLEKLALSFYSRHQVGWLMTRVISDVDTLNELLTTGIITIAADIVVIIGIAAIMLVFNWQLALITFALIPFVILATILFRKYVQEPYRKSRIYLSRVNAQLQENISGMSTVQLFTREQKNFENFDKVHRQYINEIKNTIECYALFVPAMTIITGLATGLVLYYGGSKVIAGIIMVGVVVAFLQYLGRFFTPINDLADKYNLFQLAMAASERVFKIFDTKEYIVDMEPSMPCRNISGEIKFDHVWLSYDSKVWVLQDISLTVKAGEKIALVGYTGGGKTSLISVLSRLYDISQGEILLDGQNIRKYNLLEYRKQIGVVLQDPFIFSGTIIDNIRLDRRDLKEEYIREICRDLKIDKFIEQFPNSYNEIMRERGNNLSTGQKQLIAFARIIAHNPKVFVLDEATSSVDSETELLLQQALKKILENRTSLIIAHRLSTIKDVDRIIVLHKGKIAEEGNHAELVKKNGIYKKLYELQYSSILVKDK